MRYKLLILLIVVSVIGLVACGKDTSVSNNYGWIQLAPLCDRIEMMDFHGDEQLRADLLLVFACNE